MKLYIHKYNNYYILSQFLITNKLLKSIQCNNSITIYNDAIIWMNHMTIYNNSLNILLKYALKQTHADSYAFKLCNDVNV